MVMTASAKQAAILTTCGEVTDEVSGETSKVWRLINRARRRTMSKILRVWDFIVAQLAKVPVGIWLVLGAVLAIILIEVIYYVVFIALFMINPVLAYVFYYVWVIGWLSVFCWSLTKIN